MFDTLELLHEPSQPKAATAAQLAAVERELAWVQKELARVEGELSHMGAPEDVEARRGNWTGSWPAAWRSTTPLPPPWRRWARPMTSCASGFPRR